MRLQLWDIGIRLIKQHPFLGIGLGQFEPKYQEELHRLFAEQEKGLSANPADPPSARGQPTTYNLQPEYVFRDPHNWIISFWLNLGALGLMSFIYLNYIAIKNAFSHRDNRSTSITYPPNRRTRRQLAGNLQPRTSLALALISMLLFGLIDTIYWKNDLSALWWILVLF